MKDNLIDYDEISIKMLKLLTEFSNYINRISNLNNILLANKLFNINCDFMVYINKFGMGRYYHFRCMGYMESLVYNKCYSIRSLCYWKNILVMPANNNLMMALEYLDMLKSNCKISSNPIFQELIIETDGLKMVGMEIMDKIKCYDLPC